MSFTRFTNSGAYHVDDEGNVTPLESQRLPYYPSLIERFLCFIGKHKRPTTNKPYCYRCRKQLSPAPEATQTQEGQDGK